MVMNVLGGNVDDHNKNFSFVMGRDGVWHTSPAYDYTFTVDPDAPFYVNRHSLTVNGRNQSITKKDLMSVAARFGVKGATSIIDKAVASVTGYRRHAVAAGVDERWISAIEHEIASRIEDLTA